MHHRLIYVLLAAPLMAHEGRPPEPHDLLTAWAWDPLVVIGLLVSAFLYARGARRSRGIQRWEMACYWTGWVFLAIALVSPLHSIGEALFSAHMAQHEVMMMLAAPLLVLGRPFTPYLWALRPDWRRTVGQVSKRRWFLTEPPHAWWLHFAALWVWHIPALFEATVRNDAVHAAQHISFLASALLFWYSLFRRHGANRQYGPGAFYVFTTMLHTGTLGALLTFSTAVWYPVYSTRTDAWGLTPLEDQQLGGLLMTVPPIVVYLAAFLVLFGLMLRQSDLRYRVAPLALLALLISGCRQQPHGKAHALMQQYGCPSCHVIPGVKGAEGVVGPPLTAVSRRTYLAGRIANTPENMTRWIMNPKEIDDKTAMPVMGISRDNAQEIVRYLSTLE
jgi:putative membrane protein